jgi:hypothetical protein
MRLSVGGTGEEVNSFLTPGDGGGGDQTPGGVVWRFWGINQCVVLVYL